VTTNKILFFFSKLLFGAALHKLRSQSVGGGWVCPVRIYR